MKQIRFLLVGGGGAGGHGRAGGGGGGGRRAESAYDLAPGTYAVVVGNGGVAGGSSVNVSGGNTTFDGNTAFGGGGGGTNAGSNGGCGGGSGNVNTTVATGSQGGNGGYSTNWNPGSSFPGGGGGGGQGGNGSNSPFTSTWGGGNGGPGMSDDITGASVIYGGGGGGGADNRQSGNPGTGGTGGGGNGSKSTGSPGTDGLGGGGGGGGYDGSNMRFGGNGGKGVAIFRYLTSDWGECTGGTKTTDGLYTIHTFTSSGNLVMVALVPVVVTLSPTDVTASGAMLHGSITDDRGQDIAVRGFVYGKTSESNPGDVKPEDTDYEGYVQDTGTFSEGLFQKAASGLDGFEDYYFRAFAGLSEDSGYAYGDEFTFFTADKISIKSVDPNMAIVGEEQNVTIKGENFFEGMIIEVDGIECTNVVIVDPQTVTCDVPVSEVEKETQIVISTDYGDSTSYAFFYRSVIPPPAPKRKVTARFSVESVPYVA